MGSINRKYGSNMSSAGRGASVGAPPVALAQVGIPMVLQSSGVVGNNGALSGIVALPFAYSSCYMYFTVGVLFAGSTAGWYYTVMQSTTTGTVYNNLYAGEVPTVPSVPTPIVATGPGAYIQAAGSVITSLSITIPAGSMGPHGRIRASHVGVMSNNADSKVAEVYLGGAVFSSYSFTTSSAYRAISDICNLAAAANVGNYFSGIGGAGVDWKRQSVNTAVDQVLTFTLRIPVPAADFIAIESCTVEVFYGA